jgi:hypothetical protein
MPAARYTGDRMIEKWVEVDDRVFAATLQEDGGDQLRLSVERLPGGGWDWTVWSSHREVQYGAAASLDVAMDAAEEAVAMVGRSVTSSL